MKTELAEFDQAFFDSLAEKDVVHPPNSDITHYHVIVVGGKKVGIVGFVEPKTPVKERVGFIQVILLPEFRGKGLLEKAENLLIKRYGLKIVWAKIKKSNQSSYKSHLRAGFKETSKLEQQRLRRDGFLKSDEIRLEKHLG